MPMTPRPRPRPSLSVAALLVVALLAVAATLAGSTEPNPSHPEEPLMPAYDEEGRLLLPEGYERWVFVGSALGMGYSESRGSMEMFHHTLMEPTAYEHFARTGEMREGTQFVLMLHGKGEGEVPQRRGHFAAEVHAVEMAVKDSRTFDDGWAYFDFGGMGGVRDNAEALASASCHGCHVRHAAYDNVFLQFYPLLARVAPEDSPAARALARR